MKKELIQVGCLSFIVDINSTSLADAFFYVSGKR